MEAICIAENIAEQLEKRTPFRRTMRQAIMRARNEWAREGRVPLHTIRADIDYATARAQTLYGILGIKVWVCKGEKSC